ncbi:MAG: hypothetical protein QM310_00245 [Pseudomonadota bacterium]|jgi:hypothetical protein|nr:hypothetical protein [Deltaproteobacteria bacterium]MDI9541300.1 hypothetical protein [Pseudomonadota bacterium]
MNIHQDKARIIPVRDESLLREHDIYLSPKTLRKMHCVGKNPELFIKIGARLFIDLARWDELVSKARQRTQTRVEKLRKKGLLGS